MPIRKSALGRQKAWTRDEIIEGVVAFFDREGRFPKAFEFDRFPYLPSSRSIQRNFGGLKQLKQQLGINDEYHRGKYRSEICRQINKRGRTDEDRIFKNLVEKFGEICVHREKMVSEDTAKERLDFVVYHRMGRIGIDSFYAASIQNLANTLVTKCKKYRDFHDPLYLVLTNEAFSQEQIDLLVSRKDNQPATNVSVITEKNLVEVVGKLQALTVS